MKSTTPILVSLAATLVLAGCGASETVSMTDYKALQEENRQLKDQLATLQETGTKTGSTKGGAQANHFRDLDGEMGTTPLINELAALGVFDGMGKEFKPYEPITRAEYVTWLYKAHNAIVKKDRQIRLAPSHAPGFSDISKEHPAYKYVASLANAGYSVGYDDKTFKPEQPLTREEMLAIKVGVDMGKAYGPNPSQMNYVWKFSDGKLVDERYTGYILADDSIHGEYGGNIERAFGKIGSFKPKEPVLRHEAAASLWQFGQFGDIGQATAKSALENG